MIDGRVLSWETEEEVSRGLGRMIRRFYSRVTEVMLMWNCYTPTNTWFYLMFAGILFWASPKYIYSLASRGGECVYVPD